MGAKEALIVQRLQHTEQLGLLICGESNPLRIHTL